MTNPSLAGRNTFPVSEVAALLDVSPRRLQQMARQGIVPLPDRGMYDVVGCVRGYVRFLRGEAGERLEAKQRRESALADRAELEVARTRGDLIDHSRRWLGARVAELRTAWERWPERVAALIAAELATSPETTHRVLEEHVRTFLAEQAERE